ncbi:MAG: DUF4388 domain-containing protein [Deltaproteobacteria bacterium]|nr:DUF4388 domain-containing protein [Deltaproteobacteria bacterium]
MTTRCESILIADGQAARAERLARAFELAGRPVTLAANGAAALELALSQPPRLLVVHADLPLVDAAKLSEILRANPRTRHVHFLVLGREGRRGGAAAIGDEWLEESAPSDAVVAAAARMLERQVRLEELDLGAHEANLLEGSLLDLRPAELLQMLHLRRASGRLTLSNGQDGPRAATARLGLASGELQSVDLGAVHGEKALFRILEWTEGHFRFEPGAIDGVASIKVPTRALLAEGRRQLEEWQRLAAKLPPLESPIRLRVARGELPPVLHPLTQEVLGLIENATRVGDVLDQCSQPDYQILRTLHTLAERGIIEFGRARLAPPESIAHALFSEAQVRRLRGFVQSDRRSGAPLPNAKLLVVAASEDAIQRFEELLEKVPGAELAPVPSPRCEGRTGDPKRPLTALGRLAIDGELAIDLIHLPAETAFAPLWAFAAHHALGTIVLHDARMGTSADALKDVAAALASQPAARTFHVVLLGAGERVPPEELRRNLALLDSASLFLLPLDPSKDPSSLVRSLFARIVP